MPVFDASAPPVKVPMVVPIPRRGMSRAEAAIYVGISSSKFDQLVADGRMPGPRRIDARKVWDVRDLDAAFSALPTAQEENPWDALTA